MNGMRNAAVTAANAEDKAGRYEASLVSWDAALQIDTENGNEANIYFDRLGMAIAKIGLGDMGDAQREMRDIWSYVSASGDSDMIVALYSLMAHSYEQSRPDSAQFYYEKTLAILDEARAAIGGAETQTGFISGSNRFYYEEIARYYAKLAVDDPEPWSDRAFQTVERAKARGLLDLLNNAVLGASSLEEEAILDEMYSLDTQADDYAARESALQTRYSDARAARLAEAGASGYGDRSAASIDQIRKALPKNTVMLNYALGDTASQL